MSGAAAGPEPLSHRPATAPADSPARTAQTRVRITPRDGPTLTLGRQDKRGKWRGIARALPGSLLGKTAGQRPGSTCPEVPERHSDTEAITGICRRPTLTWLAFLHAEIFELGPDLICARVTEILKYAQCLVPGLPCFIRMPSGSLGLT